MKEIELVATILGVICVVGLGLPLSRIYDWQLDLYRKWGWTACADRWERRKSWWLPLSRWILALVGAGCILTLYSLKSCTSTE